jgi:hypothetical protein
MVRGLIQKILCFFSRHCEKIIPAVKAAGRAKKNKKQNYKELSWMMIDSSVNLSQSTRGMSSIPK